MNTTLPYLSITKMPDRKRLAICITTENNISVPLAYLLKDEYSQFFCNGAMSFNQVIVNEVSRKLWG